MSQAGGTKMYAMKPVVNPDSEFIFNSKMYPMKNLLSPTDSKNTVVSDDILSDVDRRQKIILNHISDIKKHLNTLKQMIAARSSDKGKSTNTTINSPSPQTVTVNQEIVINCNVDKPPYSILVIPHLLKKVSIEVISHCHSSVSGLPQCSKLFDDLSEKTKQYGSSKLKLRLIWRKGPTETVLGLAPLPGEIPLLRLIMRLQEEQNAAKEVEMLDVLDSLQLRGLDTVPNKPDGSFLLGSSSPSVIDAAVWSLVRSLHAPPSHLSSWFSSFSALVGA